MDKNFLRYITLKRLINFVILNLSYEISKYSGKLFVWGKPYSFSIEPTNHCNFHCPECPSGLGRLTRPLGFMNFADFKNIIDQIHGTVCFLQLFLQGEPYLNKKLPAMIEYAQSKKMYVCISTNGSVFNRKNIDSLFECSPDRLIFSLDGLDEESYQNYRVGGTFKKADESLKLIISKKNESVSSKPFVELQFLVMKQNEHQMKDVIKYGKSAGVDKITFKTMQVYSFESAEKYLPANPEYSRYVVNENKIDLKVPVKNRCYALWRTSVATWDGRLVPCCFDKDAEYTLGMINGKNFKKIWKGEAYNNFRKAVFLNRKNIPLCTNCTEGMNMNIRGKI